jgi:hypothetical protein
MKKCLILLFISTSIFAHNGGHYQSGDRLKIWHLISGETLLGNYSSNNQHEIIIEQRSGKKIHVPIQQLTYENRRFAQMKMRQIAQIQSTQDSLLVNFSQSSLLLICFTLGLLILLEKFNSQLRYTKFAFYIFLLFFIDLACKSTAEINPISNNTSTPNLLPKSEVSFLDSAFAPYKAQVNTSSDGNYYYVNSTGIPNHNMMVGIKSWQQQVPIPQPYTGANHWSIPLQPVYASSPLSTSTNLMKGALALAVNGIPIFNALNNRGEDSYTIGELDQWGGHCGRADDYHYHVAPLHLSTISGLKPIAFALDGFPVYGLKEPDGSSMLALDNAHGHEWKNSYHYHVTSNYPYVIGAMKGKVSLDPATSAPENQIIPQAFASPIRPALTPLNGAIIDDFVSPTNNSYQLSYHIGTKTGSVKFSWNATGLYNFTFTDINGTQTTSTYQRK